MLNFAGRGEPLTKRGFAEAGDLLGVPLSVLWAVVTVETAGCGFLDDRRPVVLFERHEFRRRTAGRFDVSHPEISGPPGHYGPGGAHQHERLAVAVGLDRRASLESASWGLGQVMGYNAGLAGYADAETMVDHFCHNEDQQLLGMARFIKSSKLDGYLRRNAWADFARGYNGPGYAANQYDAKLAHHAARFASRTLPDLTLRAIQLLLRYAGFDAGPVDGYPGQRTSRAIAAFRAANRLGDGDCSDETLLTALMKRLPADGRPGLAPAKPAPSSQA
jgi:hypothetical protein